jgi:hypothetical protein
MDEAVGWSGKIDPKPLQPSLIALADTNGPPPTSRSGARPPLRRLSQEPLLLQADHFARDEEITHVLRRAASIEQRRPARMTFSNDSRGFAFEMLTVHDAVLQGLMADISEQLGLENRLPETLRFRRYSRGQSHRLHTDAYAIAGHSLLATAILYLDDAEGGETWFPDARGGAIGIQPRRGRLAVWVNYGDDGELDPLARHAGLEVRSETKTTITQFFYNDLIKLAGLRARLLAFPPIR